MMRKPPLRPMKKGSLVSIEDSVPATPGSDRTTPTIVSRASLPLGGLRPGHALDDEQDPVGKRRLEPALEILPDLLRLPGRHPRGDFEILLDVARSRDQGAGDEAPRQDDRPPMANNGGGPTRERRHDRARRPRLSRHSR